jgi:phage terminase small subunit
MLVDLPFLLSLCLQKVSPKNKEIFFKKESYLDAKALESAKVVKVLFQRGKVQKIDLFRLSFYVATIRLFSGKIVTTFTYGV